MHLPGRKNHRVNMAERTKQDARNNPTDTFIDHMHQLRAELMALREEYDISDSSELMWYENGDSIAPSLNDSLMDFFEFYRETIQEDRYHNPQKRDRYMPFDISLNKTVIFCSWKKYGIRSCMILRKA